MPIQTMLKWNPRKKTFDRVTASLEEIEAWRNTPRRIRVVEDTRYQHDTSGLDYDRPVKTRINSKAIGTLIAEGVVTDKRVIDGKTEYLVRPHTKATRLEFETREKRRELAELEKQARMEPDAPEAFHVELNRRIAELHRELGE